MKKDLRSLLITMYAIIRDAVVNMIKHDGVEHAGYLAFLGLLSLFPFLVFVFAVIGFIGQGEAGSAFITSVLENAPGHITDALKPRIIEIISGPPQGLLTVSILGTIWTASSAVEGLRTTLNRAYHVHTPPAYWFRRTLSIIQLMLFTCILITGMLAVVFIPLLLSHLEGWLGIQFISTYQHFISTMIFFGAIGTLFLAICYIYYIIPNIKQSFLSVAPGALMVVVSWLWAANLFTLYLANVDQVSLIYGSLGGIIAALLFFYICNVIFIFGAELNCQIVHYFGMKVTQRDETGNEDSSQ